VLDVLAGGAQALFDVAKALGESVFANASLARQCGA